MLVLTRKKGEQILIGQGIVITFLGGGSHGEMRVGIDAPEEVQIVRKEIAGRFNSLGEKLSPKTEDKLVEKPTIAYKPKIRRWGNVLKS
jgi:carbon storage regulator